MGDFKKVNEIYAKCEFCNKIVNVPSSFEMHNFKSWRETFFNVFSSVADFPAPSPARSTYQVAALPLNAKIEIECIATL